MIRLISRTAWRLAVVLSAGVWERGGGGGGGGGGGVVTGHADAGELPDAVQAGGVVLAGHGEALVDVDLAAGAGVAAAALALEGPLCVHALPEVLAGVGTWGGVQGTVVRRRLTGVLLLFVCALCCCCLCLGCECDTQCSLHGCFIFRV